MVAHSALYQRLVTKPELQAVVRDCARWPRVDKARQVISFSDGRAESPFESIARVSFHDGGLPEPDLQVWVGDDLRVIGHVRDTGSCGSTTGLRSQGVAWSSPAGPGGGVENRSEAGR